MPLYLQADYAGGATMIPPSTSDESVEINLFRPTQAQILHPPGIVQAAVRAAASGRLEKRTSRPTATRTERETLRKLRPMRCQVLFSSSGTRRERLL
jgi:hypothetical protein